MPEETMPRADWPARAADMVVRYVDNVRSATTDRVLSLAKGVVYGSFAVVIGLLIAVLALIGVFRGADRIREFVVADSVWLTYVSLGFVFCVSGRFVFARRKKAPRS
jgi:uncharacterized protein YacL